MLPSDYQSFNEEERAELTRLVDAWYVAKRRKMWITLALFGERLMARGAYLDYEGNWRLLDDLGRTL